MYLLLNIIADHIIKLINLLQKTDFWLQMSGNREKNQAKSNTSPNISPCITPPLNKNRRKGIHLNTHITFIRQEKRSKYLAWTKYLEVEVLMLLNGCLVAMVFSIQDSLLYDSLCKKEFNNETRLCYNLSQVQAIPNGEKRLEYVHIEAGSHRIYVHITEIIVGFISSTFFCPWSDLQGRRFPLVISILTWNFDLLSFFYKDVQYRYFIYCFYISHALSQSMGGHICILTMVYSYVADHSTNSERTFRYTMTDVCFSIGLLIGVQLYTILSLTFVVFLVIFIIRITAVLMVIWLFIDTSFKIQAEGISKKFKSCFTMYSLKSIMHTISRWRHNCGSEQLQIVIISVVPIYLGYSMIGSFMTYSGYFAIIFEHINEYKAILKYFTIYTCFCEASCIVIIKFFHGVRDSTLGLMGVFSLYFYTFVLGFAKDRIAFFVALSLTLFKGFAAVAIHSIASKIVEADERGQTFLVLATCEILSLLVGFVFHTKFIYLAGRTYPEISHMVLASLYTIPFCAFTFQIMSINTEHLFSSCYRMFQVPQNVTIDGNEPSGNDDESSDDS